MAARSIFLTRGVRGFGRIYPPDWKGAIIEQSIEVVDNYIRCYNEKRIKIPFGSLSPIECRVSLGLAARNQPKFLSLTPAGQICVEINSVCHMGAGDEAQ